MLSNPLIAFGNAYNFEFTDDCAYGEIESFLVSVSSDGYKKIAFINFFTPETEEGDSMAKYKLSESIKNMAVDYPALSDYEVFLNGVLVRTGADLKEFDVAVTALCQALKELGFLGMPVCSECGYSVDGTPAYFSIINNRATYTCDECTEVLKADALVNNTETKYGSKKRGVFGAIVGGLLSFAIALVLFIFVIPHNGIKFGSDETDRLNALIFAIPLSALISFTSFLFYRLFTKRKGSERILPCFIVSALYSVVSVYCSTAIVYTNSFGLSFSSACRMFSTIFCSPVIDPYYRNTFICYGLYSLAAVIAVTLIYSLIFDTKKPAPPVFILCGGDEAGIEETVEEEDVTASEECPVAEEASTDN